MTKWSYHDLLEWMSILSHFHVRRGLRNCVLGFGQDMMECHWDLLD